MMRMWQRGRMHVIFEVLCEQGTSRGMLCCNNIVSVEQVNLLVDLHVDLTTLSYTIITQMGIT